jgi:hypothetical protein
LNSPRWAGAGKFVSTAQRVGYPEPARHTADQLCRVSAGHPGGGDKQRARRGNPQHWDSVGHRGKRRLGHADHRDPELGVGMRARPGPRWQAPGVQCRSLEQAFGPYT